jgi:cyclic pyranopterin phosphate synthase
VDYEFEDGRGEVGVVASVTEPFCATCNRARLTADGKLVTCLFSSVGHDIKALLRSGVPDEKIFQFITGVWGNRKDRYSSERLEALRDSSYDPTTHKKIEMITLGG